MFTRWVMQQTRCTACGLRFDRGERDYFIGAYTLNLIVALLAAAASIAIGAWATWPDVPWNTLKYSIALCLLVLPLVTYPFSKSLWLAIDLILRPAEPRDFE